MKIRNSCYRAAYGLGAALVGLSASAIFGVRAASAAANQPGSPRPQGQTPAPNILVKQNDLAADSLLVAPGVGQPSPGSRTSLTTVLVATCKNLGAQTYKPGYRAVRIYHTVGGIDHVVAAGFVPQLGPGKTFWITYQIPVDEDLSNEDNDGYWMEVSQGSTPDEKPANDTNAKDIHILAARTPMLLPVGNRN